MPQITVFTTDHRAGNHTEIDVEDETTVAEAIWMLANGMLLVLQSIPNRRNRRKLLKETFRLIKQADRRLNNE